MNKNLEILKKIFSGAVVKDYFTIKVFRYILLLVFLMVLLIHNRYRAEKNYHRKEKMVFELKQVKFKYITTEKQLINFSKESQLLNDTVVKSLGLKLPENPPKRIYINN